MSKGHKENWRVLVAHSLFPLVGFSVCGCVLSVDVLAMTANGRCAVAMAQRRNCSPTDGTATQYRCSTGPVLCKNTRVYVKKTSEGTSDAVEER